MDDNSSADELDSSDTLLFYGLGGCNEVGRSCHIIKYKGKVVMLDAGMHPAYDGFAALPFYDEYDLSTVDVLLISHFHIDHAASLPYVLSKTNFKGRVFMTHPTKAIYKWLVQDSVRVGTISSSSEQKIQLYTEADHLSTFPMIEAIDYYTTHTISSIRITPYPAGHVLGAAMFLIEIAGLKILFTGDYSREEDRHLISASIPPLIQIDVLITESTYGAASHIPRLKRESMLMKTITGILAHGGRALLPVFALGRAQELLLILDEYWSKHPEYQKFPIYYASNLARKCMVVYQTYISAMNDNIKRLFRERMAEAEAVGNVNKAGPWDFKFIRSLKSLDRFDDIGPCVMLASPGMMQNGVSRELLERWAPDQRNGVIITGYSVEGTMAKLIMTEPEFITAVMTRGATAQSSRDKLFGQAEQTQIPRRCSVHEFAFAAHVDGQENREFVEEVGASVVILVHGEKAQMTRLKSKLLGLNSKRKTPIKVFSPPNCEELKIPFRFDKMAEIVGKLADVYPPVVPVGVSGNPSLNSAVSSMTSQAPHILTGVLVKNDFKLSLMAPEDLREYAGLTTTQVTCRQRLRLSSASIELIRWALEGTFGSVKVISSKDEGCKKLAHEDCKHVKVLADMETNTDINANMGISKSYIKREEEYVSREDLPIQFEIMDCVLLEYEPPGKIEVSWEGNTINDSIADAVMAVLLTVESSPAAIKYSTSSDHVHSVPVQARNPYSNASPETRLSRLLLYLESQFGDTIAVIKRPPLNSKSEGNLVEVDSKLSQNNGIDANSHEEMTPEEMKELQRLHSLGIPVPGIEIVVDGHVAKVWLENLEVECSYALLKDRVRAVVDKGIEVSAVLGS